MLEQLETIYQEALSKLETINNADALHAWEIEYLGKKGAVTLMLRSTGQLPKEERASFGKRANEIKDLLAEAHSRRETLIRDQELARSLEEGEVDVTLPGRAKPVGGLHPSTQTLRKFYDIWADMGFQVYRSRDVEDDDTNFTLLNIPPYHPARDMQDTFYTTTPNVILRTHTSPGQIRAMRDLGGNGSQPIRVILPGMCYRYEQITARSEIQFHQVEGLAVGRNIHMSDLKGTIAEFARRMYGANAQVRFRASYFPFTEPSMEVDVECFLCGGSGCRVCKYAGWLEIAGSGMVHPVVLRNGGYDPTQWSGFAFGMGPERMTMLMHGINDIRYFWGNDLRFLEQF
jgi:phenylalanyl-tRNA synthetase alpha chain